MINFTKYHGLGNDFIFFSHRVLEQFPTLLDLKNFVIHICHRGFSVGADGVVFVRFIQSTQKVQIVIINSDGSFAATCGNALRCLGLKLWRENKWNGKKPISVFRLPLNCKYTQHLDSKKSEEKYLLNIDYPFSTLSKISFEKTKNRKITAQNNAIVDVVFESAKNIVYWQNLSSLKEDCNLPYLETLPVFVQLENPHLVFISKDFANWTNDECCAFGKQIQTIENVNIGLLCAESKKLRVFERGAGLTLACGSGAIAAALALQFAGLLLNSSSDTTNSQDQNFTITLNMPGGLVTVILHSKHSILSAAAEFVCVGKMPDYVLV